MNGEEIFSNNTLFQIDAENPSQLVIKEFNKQYEGEYKCIIKNKLGDAAATGNLSLAGFDIISIILFFGYGNIFLLPSICFTLISFN